MAVAVFSPSDNHPGFSKRQAEVVVGIVVAGMEESTLRSTALIATKRDLVDLKQELAEKVFNSSMKFDIGCVLLLA